MLKRGMETKWFRLDEEREKEVRGEELCCKLSLGPHSRLSGGGHLESCHN